MKIRNRRIVCKSCAKETYSDLEKLIQDEENSDRAIYTCECGSLNRIKKEGLCSMATIISANKEKTEEVEVDLEW
jgi:hypothetical protein